MNSILQGTTPTLTISIDVNDVSLSDVEEIELTFMQMNEVSIKSKADCELDLDANTISYHFTQTETLNMIPTRQLDWQLRIMTNDGEIMGTRINYINVSDLMSNEVM